MPDRSPNAYSYYETTITLPDGVILMARVHRPASVPAPVVLMRSPYPLADLRYQIDVIEAVRRGLAVVMVNHRGTGMSTGVFEPWVDDAADGFQCIEWCANQPWSTGSVVTHGRSYVAQTQLYAASTAHPALKAMSVEVCPSDPYDIVYRGRALRLGFAGSWAIAQAQLAAIRSVPMDDAPSFTGDPYTDLLQEPSTLGELSHLFPSWGNWLAHPQRDDWWIARALPDRPAIPTLYVAGWHDVFLPDTLAEFARDSHPGSRLVVGPWDHGAPVRALGSVDYGPQGAADAVGLATETLDYLTAYAQGGQPPSRPRVRYFVTGINEWRTSDQWPPPSENLELHFSSDASLGTEPPEEPSEVAFALDLTDPTRTTGGANLFPTGGAAFAAGSWPQCTAPSIDKVTFVTSPLHADLCAIGPVLAELCTFTEADISDWAVKLIDVAPDGVALNVVDGMLRHHRSSTESPGGSEALLVEVGTTAHCFRTGHRIMVEISGASFPQFDVHHGTYADGAPRESVRHQRIQLGAGLINRLLLAVPPNSSTSPLHNVSSGTAARIGDTESVVL